MYMGRTSSVRIGSWRYKVSSQGAPAPWINYNDMPRGGKREGAGRKAREGGSVHRAFRLYKDDADFIKDTAQEIGISQSDVIHMLVEQYKKDCETGC